MMRADLGFCCSCLVSVWTHAGAYCPETCTQVKMWGKTPLICWRSDMQGTSENWQAGKKSSLAQAEMFVLRVAFCLPKCFPNLAAASPWLLSRGTSKELQLDELLQLCRQLAPVCCCPGMRPARKILLLRGFPAKDGRMPCLLTAENEADGRKNHIITPAWSCAFLQKCGCLRSLVPTRLAEAQDLSKAHKFACSSKTLIPCSSPGEIRSYMDRSAILCGSATGTGHLLSSSFWLSISFKK